MKRDEAVYIKLGKYEGYTGTVLRVSKGAGYWYLVQLNGEEKPQWIHRMHVGALV